LRRNASKGKEERKNVNRSSLEFIFQQARRGEENFYCIPIVGSLPAQGQQFP